MKKPIVAGIAAAAFCAAPALAADMPVKAPPMVPMFDWSGFYVGGHAGYGWGKADWTWEIPLPGLGDERHGADPAGGLWGTQIGLQRQWGNFVGGMEVTWSGGNLKDTNPVTAFGLTRPYEARFSSIFTAALRAGIARDNWLVYAKGGFASAEDRLRTFDNIGDLQTTSQKRDNGGVVGVGAEYGLTQNWIFGVEYDYIWLNAKDRFAIQVPPTNFSSDLDPKLHVQSIVARLSYKFGDWGKGPVSAKY